MNKIADFFRSIGPAIIVAAVVCGPGSILMNSKAGAIYEYNMIWVLAFAALMMWCMVLLSARLGVVHEHTPIEELSRRLGRPVGIFIGITLFLVVAGFQVSNNIAIVAAVETFTDDLSTVTKVGILLLLNACIVVVLYGFRNLYNRIEKIMKTIVLMMVVSFIINLVLAKPDFFAMLRGLIPSPPEGGYKAFFSDPTGGGDVLVLQALVATTFSVAGAFYQAYGVRAKGWKLKDAKRGMIDSFVGTSVLFGVSLIVMSTSAAALHGKADLSNIDYYTNGFAPGALYILAGRPSMGKTALALGIAQHAAGVDKNQTLFFSLEMSTTELSDRVAAAQIGVSAWKIEKGDLTDRQVQQIGESVGQVKPWPLYIDDDHDTSLSNLRTKALEHKMEHGLDFIVIDYLQLVELPHGMRPKENFHQEISIISRGLKKLARELEVPILALSQLNRSVENTPQCIPQLSHLRESGKIEEDAHLVILLWREGYYNEDCEQPDMTTAFIRKNRQGPIGTAELIFNKRLMTFTPLDKLHDSEVT